MTSTIVIIVMIAVIAFNQQLMSLFTNDAEVISIGAEYLIIISSFYLLFSTMFIFTGVMRGVFALWFVRIPVALFLSKSIGVTGIWWATPTGWFFGMATSIIYYFTGRWKNKSVVKHTK